MARPRACWQLWEVIRLFGYAAAAKQLGLSETVLMPDTAPDNKEAVLRGFGVVVERMPYKDLLEGRGSKDTRSF